MSKIFSKFKRTTIDELVGSLDERTITSVAVANGGTGWAVGDVVQIAGGTVMKVNTISANAVLTLNVVASGTYSNLVALSNVAIYNVANSVANSVYGGRETVSGANLKINVALDTNAPKKNRFYFVASGITQYDEVQAEKETEFDSFLNIWDETLFGKVADMIPVARRVDWELDETYYPYDDRDQNLRTKNFFVINGGHVFKCIDNGANSSVSTPQSTIAPAYIEGLTPVGTPFSSGDGYIWIHMGSLDAEVDTLFGTTSYFPVQEYANTKNAAIDGGLFSVKVTAGGTEYPTVTGVTAAPIGSSTNRVALAGVLANPSFYENCGIYISNNSSSFVKQIDTITINSSNPSNIYTEVTLAQGENFPAEFLQLNQNYTISPYVNIESKTGTGAAAYSVVAADGSIDKIVMVNYGSGYKDAITTIENAQEIGSGAELRAIISPSGGHCSNIFDELYVDSVSVSSKFDQNTYPISTKYSTIALLKNPTYRANNAPFYGQTFLQTIDIPLESKSGDLIEGEFVDSNVLDAGIGRYPSGKVAFSNTSLLQLTGVDGNFVPGSVLTGRTSGDYGVAGNTAVWNSYFDPDKTEVGADDYVVKPYSGEILYAKNVELVERSNQSEIIKIIVKF